MDEYSIRLTCLSASKGLYVCIFQRSNMWTDSLIPVVWYCTPIEKGHIVSLHWKKHYSVYCCREETNEQQDIFSKDVITLDADPTHSQNNTFTLSYSSEIYHLDTPELKKEVDDKTIFLTTDTSIPPGRKVYAGFCVSGNPVCMLQVSPNIPYQFNTELQYGILAGTFEQGTPLNNSDIERSYSFTLSKDIPSKAFILRENNTWEEGCQELNF
ncbi:MAG: hypothetical protein LBT13_03530 [Treponema sp.]|nr:hypothetical protein [Treponema sp.]